MSDKLSAHLSWSEVLRGSGYTSLSDVPVELREAMKRTAAEVFERLRAEADVGGMKIISGLRSPRSNAAAKGARKSQHMVGTALDVRPISDPESGCVSVYDAASLMMDDGRLTRGGLCIYAFGSWDQPGDWRPRFVHVDRRGRRAKWSRLIRWSDGVARWTSLRRDNLIV